MTNTIFVTGGSGFIGTEFVKAALAAGHQVQVLTRSQKSAERIKASGALPVLGNILEPGDWQQVAAKSQVVFHLAQPETYGAKVTIERAQAFSQERLKMDANLLVGHFTRGLPFILLENRGR